LKSILCDTGASFMIAEQATARFRSGGAAL
jgi:hypothetical protein